MNNTGSGLRTQNPVLDAAKLVLSLMILALHSGLFPLLLQPWLRLAVPMFFMLSSFFFFSSLRGRGEEERRERLGRFVKRNLRLYFFWFILLLPHIIDLRYWAYENELNMGPWVFLLWFIRNMLFSSSFVASWFISALIIGTVLIFFLSRKMGSRGIFLLSLLCYLLCCLHSGEEFLVRGSAAVNAAFKIYDGIFTVGYNSFPVALIWISMGKGLAERESGSFRGRDAGALAASAALLYAEWTLVRKVSGVYNYDCYIMLLPTAWYAMRLLLSIRCPELMSPAASLSLRRLSTVIFASHGFMLSLSDKLINVLSLPGLMGLSSFLLSLALCLAAAFIILRAGKYRCLRWLSFAY